MFFKLFSKIDVGKINKIIYSSSSAVYNSIRKDYQYVDTNNKSLYERMRLFKSHGIIRSKSKHWEYDIASPGLNFRLSDINCALGISQLKKIR